MFSHAERLVYMLDHREGLSFVSFGIAKAAQIIPMERVYWHHVCRVIESIIDLPPVAGHQMSLFGDQLFEDCLDMGERRRGPGLSHRLVECVPTER